MNNVLDRLPDGARVIIVRLRSLGDCVLTTPALHLVKSYRPDLELSVIVEDRFRAVFEGNPDLSSVDAPHIPALARSRPALCVNLHGGTRSAVLTAASQAQVRAGFEHYRWPALYDIRIPRAQEILGEERTVHTAEHLASAMFFLGVEGQEIPRACLFAPPVRRNRPYAVLHAFASRADKTWPADRFVALARELAGEVQPIFIAGPDDDIAPFGEFETIANAPLRDVMSLIAGASLFVGNDSGPAHIAAAYGVPSVVLFGASNAAIWGPWKTQSRVLTAPYGMDSIGVPEVLSAVDAVKAAA